MAAETNSPSNFLDAAYSSLGLNSGELLSAVFSPTEETNLEQWLNKGDWLSLAKQVGAEKIFFVKDDPVIVFAQSETHDAASLRKIFNDIWCMARPQRLFLASGGQLAVYDLTKAPVKEDRDWEQLRPLAVARGIAEIAKELKSYHREQVESGRLFEEKHFGDDNQRADQSLIRDLKLVRNELTDASSEKSLEHKYAHALIGRSIFICYLEDRGILTRDYFENVAKKHRDWKSILDSPLNKPDINPDMERRLYPRILGNKDFTCALFDQLSEDFNGDMFPSDPHERKAINRNHLKLIQEFLRGDIDNQKNLFFWAYKFDIIPIELISSIYEEFYLTTNADSGNHGTHYTPSSLVRFVLSQVLTSECLERNPRILDPCCGSGIFLVEAFRRIVRYRFYTQEEMPSAKELKQIIKTQIAGIEINEEAIRVTAFSLYLALLHFQKPPAIWGQIKKGQRLPSLKYQENSSEVGEKFNNLIEANAFDVAEKVKDNKVLGDFCSNCADVIIGNPPWGQPKKGDSAGTEALAKALSWCHGQNYPVGDKERSQAFIWRTLDFLKDGGTASLLVSTGIFFKHHIKSQNFRVQWLSSIRLIEVINFSHVRDIFFSGAVSPFASVVFQKSSESHDQQQVVNYFSAKKSAQAVHLKSVILSQPDLQRIRQSDLIANDKLWKIYWWGNHRDAALINTLDLNLPLRELCNSDSTGRGFEEREGSASSTILRQYKELPSKGLKRYGILDKKSLKPVPARVGRLGKSIDLYSGMRILVKRGITQQSLPKGQIVARLESEKFCFRHSIYCVKLADPDDWKYKIILAIMWSSLARYYFFLTTSTWGTWHHEIHHEELLELPIRLPDSKKKVNELIEIIDKLRNSTPTSRSNRSRNSLSRPNSDIQLEMGIDMPHIETVSEDIVSLENRLDEAIFNLYSLRKSERDLIRDMCDLGIEFFYNEIESNAVKPIATGIFQQKFGLLKTISDETNSSLPEMLKDYLTIFLNSWNRELSPDGELNWRIIIPDQSLTMLCLVFSTQEMGVSPQPSNENQDAWKMVLNVLDDALLVPYKSNQIYIDHMVRAVTDTDIIIIKRNERRLWTRSMAREDIEATLLQTINLQEARQHTLS
jgi:type I restriction-modification system DNA methylase subunit